MSDQAESLNNQDASRQSDAKVPIMASDIFIILSRYWRRRPLLFIASIISILAVALADLILPVAAGMMVDRMTNATSENGDMSSALSALYIFAAASVVAFGSKWIHARFWMPFAAHNMAELATDTFTRVQRFSSDWHANTFAGATVRKVTRGKRAYDTISDIFWMNFLQLGVILTGFTGLIIWRFPLVGIIFAATIIIYIAASVWLAHAYVRPANLRSAAADSAIGAAISDSITNNATVKAFGAELREDQMFANVTNYWARRATVSWNRGRDLGAVQQALWTVLQVSTVALLMFLAIRGEASAGDVTFILTTNFMLGGRLRQVGDDIRQLQRATSEFDDVIDFHKRPFQIKDPKNAPEFSPGPGRIDFNNVFFAYGPGHQQIYSDFSLSIQPGERIGLVGPSGAGKSTFVKLIQRLYDVNAGQILIDGQPIHTVQQSSLRRHIAIVPQDPLLFHRSLAENISYGRPGASLDDIRHAAERARAANFIEKLEHGYDTLVGERGVKLSGGERQRVAIARAFLADTPIVVFDEATSSLDTITEKHIQDAMAELMQGRTTIIIAHRLSTVRDADRILVFEDGRVVEEGTHSQLMQSQTGQYQALYNMQTRPLACPDGSGQ